MRSKNYLILLFLFFSVPGMRYSRAQQSSQCIAVITEINGKALLKETGTSQFEKATWGTRLFTGDQIATDDKSEVKLLYSDNNIIIIRPNSMITVSEAESPVSEPVGDAKGITVAAMVNLTSLTLKKDASKDVGALAGVRSVTPSLAIELESPYNTKIKTDRPTFSWITNKSFDKYTVNLYNSKGLVWSTKVSELTMSFPESKKGLEFGESYFWNVEGEYIIDNEKSASHKFTVLTSEKSKEVGEQEALIRNSFKETPESSTFHSVLAAYYIDQGLLQDAIIEFRIIAKINVDAPLPHEILGSLYSEVGDKDKAIDELQKALSLSNKKGN